MYPHERSLVERMKDKPFALIGINSDPKEKLLEAIKREKMTWRSFWDGGSTGGPIATKWNVRGWPTYLEAVDAEWPGQCFNADQQHVRRAMDDGTARRSLSSMPRA